MPGAPALLTSTTTRFDRDRYAEKLKHFNASNNYRIDLDHLLLVLDRIPFASLLDVGCGTGYFMDLVRQRYHEPRIEGVDRFDYGAANCTITDICATNFGWKRQYDVVTVIHAINHFAELDIALSRLAMLTNPRGHLVILTPNPAFVRMIRLLNEYAYLTTRGGDETVIAYLGMDDLVPRLKMRRFSLVETRTFGTTIDCMLRGSSMPIPERLLLVFRNDSE